MNAKIKRYLLFKCRLIITKKKYKDFWMEEETHILIWMLSKYSELHGYQNVEKDIVLLFLFRLKKIGNLFLRYTLELLPKVVNSNG